MIKIVGCIIIGAVIGVVLMIVISCLIIDSRWDEQERLEWEREHEANK